MTAPKPTAKECRSLQQRIASQLPPDAGKRMEQPACQLTLVGHKYAVADIYDAAIPEWVMIVGGSSAMLNLELGTVEIVASCWWPWDEGEEFTEVSGLDPIPLK